VTRGILKNNKGERFMFNYISEPLRAGDRRYRRGGGPLAQGRQECAPATRSS